jgi:hypothetical protein
MHHESYWIVKDRMRPVQHLTVNGCGFSQMLKRKHMLSDSRRAAMRGTSGQTWPMASGRKASSTMERRRGTHPREPKPIGRRGTGRAGSTLSIAAVAPADGSQTRRCFGARPSARSIVRPHAWITGAARSDMEDGRSGRVGIVARPAPAGRSRCERCAVTFARSGAVRPAPKTASVPRPRDEAAGRRQDPSGKNRRARIVAQDPSGPNSGLPFRTASSARSSGSCRWGCATGSPRGAGRGPAP